MAKKKVFVSFDYENDKHYKYLLEAWDKNPQFEFSFSDLSSKEIDSWNIPTIKSVLSRKINEANYTLVIIGAEANKKHKDTALIGYKNWQNFEVAKSKEWGNKLVGIKINSLYGAPEELLNSGAKWALSFTQEAILNALNSF
jgi:hypothetical protein